MIRSLSQFSLALLVFLGCYSFGQPVAERQATRAERLADLMARVSIHEAQVDRLLSKDPVPKTDFDLPPPVQVVSPALAPELPSPPTPAMIMPDQPPAPSFSEYEEPVEGEAVKEVSAHPFIDVDDSVEDPNEVVKSASTSDENSSEDLDAAYAKLYDSDIPSRHKGYYFGPLLGFIFPANVTTRSPHPSGSGFLKNSYKSDSGYLIGLQGGRDFGSIRVEGDYAYNSFDASDGVKASFHSFMSRIILEKEIGERFDIRGGLGMGLGFVSLEKTTEFSGTGFAYDFLFGLGYRVAENWGLQLDYRYFLTAANDNYDRLKSHIWLISASLDL